MSNISPQGEQNTTVEIAALANLTALSTTPVGQMLVKTGTGTFANIAAPATVTIKVGGVNAGSQTILNLKAGGNMTITDDGSGGITFASTATGGGGGGSGTVTSVSVSTNQGVSGSVANATTTPTITLSLGALTGVTSFNGLVVTPNSGTITAGVWNGTAIGSAFLIPAGTSQQIQFNDGGTAFGASSNFTFDKNSGTGVFIGDGAMDFHVQCSVGRSPLGAILTFAVNAAGSGYANNDVATVSGGNGDATLKFTISGKTSFWTILNPGSGYSIASGVTTTGGSGSGLTININSVAPDPGIYQTSGGTINLIAGAGVYGGNGGSVTIQAGLAGTTGGDGAISIVTSGLGNININPGTNGHFKIKNNNGPCFGIFSFVGGTAFVDRTYSFPDTTGTVALISDLTSFVSTVANARVTAQAAANTNILTYTVGASDGTFQLAANVLVTTSTLHSFGVTVDYTDESGTARTLTIPFSQLAGTLITAITNATGASAYEGVSLTIRAKATTTIIFKTAGTFTTVAYNADCSVIKIA